ncbi:MAG TPA: integrase [Candidatus Nitrosocosmicus sp.]|nr:integrase [Candidatus Nitrosocosmicus sp.]
MLRPGFEPGIVALRGNKQIPALMNNFREYLETTLKLEKTMIKNRMAYASKYSHLLDTWDLSELVSLSNEKRGHIMRALVLLSKYKGQYDKWQDVRRNYQLKWSSIDSLKGFQNILVENGDLNNMVDWIRMSIGKYPRLRNILLYNTLTGLRPSEVVESFNLFQSSYSSYTSVDGKRLEHFKFPSIFLRRTKKAFFSIVNENILKILKDPSNEIHDFEKIRLVFQRNNQRLKMSYCRKVFATFLRNEGVEAEIIDLLQGRIPNSIFVRHYYRPPIEKFDQLSKLIDKLYNLVNSK